MGAIRQNQLKGFYIGEVKTVQAKEFLSQIYRLDKMIENKIAECEKWETIAQSITAHSEGERVQSSGNPQKMEAAICHCVDLEREIYETVGRLASVQKEVVGVIEQLEDTLQYDILHKRYVQYKSLTEIAIETRYSYQYIVEVHKKAVNKVQEYLNIHINL